MEEYPSAFLEDNKRRDLETCQNVSLPSLVSRMYHSVYKSSIRNNSALCAQHGHINSWHTDTHRRHFSPNYHCYILGEYTEKPWPS